MIKDQWVPCTREWQERYPNACGNAPTRPAREGMDADHYHLENNPSIGDLARFQRASIAQITPY